MGLDIYAGPLCRYYVDDWKSVVQQAAEEQGIQFRRVRQHEPPADALVDPAAAVPIILAWRAAVEKAAGDLLPPLTWDERPDGPYFTDKPDWDGYWSVYFLAAHDQFPETAAPQTMPVPSRMPDPTKERLFAQVQETYHHRPSKMGLRRRLFGSPRVQAPPELDRRYGHIFLPDMWLPVDFEEPLVANDPAGNRAHLGSAVRLAAQLEMVNDRTLRGDAAMLDAWRRGGPPDTHVPLEETAKFGLAVLLAAAHYSVEHRVPVKLDP